MGLVRSSGSPWVGSVGVVSLWVEGLRAIFRGDDVGLCVVSFVSKELEDCGKDLLSV